MTRCVSLSMVVDATAGVIYRMAPDNKPRNIEKIMDHVINYFKTNGKCYQDFYYMELAEEDVYKTIKEMMMSCPEFLDLNLSQDEVDRGVKIDNPERPPFAFVTRDTYIKSYYDFIDLDACIGNIVAQIKYNFFDDDVFDGRIHILSDEEYKNLKDNNAVMMEVCGEETSQRPNC